MLSHVYVFVHCVEDPSESSPLKKFPFRIRHSTSQSTDLHSDLLSAPRRSLRQQGVQAEEDGFPYYSITPKKKQLKQETVNQETREENTHDKLASQIETSKICALKRDLFENSNVRRQIIPIQTAQSPPAILTNGTTDSLDSLSMESSSETKAAEALIEMGTGTPSKALQNSENMTPRSPTTECVDVTINRRRLLALFEKVVVGTEGVSCEQIERIHTMLEHIIFRHRMSVNRSSMLEVGYCIVYSCFDYVHICAGLGTGCAAKLRRCSLTISNI